MDASGRCMVKPETLSDSRIHVIEICLEESHDGLSQATYPFDLFAPGPLLYGSHGTAAENR